MNAVLVKGDAVGPTLYYGRGRRRRGHRRARWSPTSSTSTRHGTPPTRSIACRTSRSSPTACRASQILADGRES